MKTLLDDLRLEDLFLPATLQVEPQSAPEPTAHAAAPGNSRDPEWLAFEADVRSARIRLKRAAMARIDANKEPARISVRAVIVEAGRSRSQLYASHAHLLPLIAAAQAAMERLVERRTQRARIAAAKPSRSALEIENRKLRADVRRLEAVNASKLAAEMHARMFPNDGQRNEAEIAHLKAVIARKDVEIQAFSSLATALSALMPLGTAPGRVIDAEPGSSGPSALD